MERMPSPKKCLTLPKAKFVLLEGGFPDTHWSWIHTQSALDCAERWRRGLPKTSRLSVFLAVRIFSKKEKYILCDRGVVSSLGEGLAEGGKWARDL